MTSQVTYQGETLEDLTGQLNYAIWALSHEMENWERKEYEAVKADCEFKIASINERLEEIANGY